MQDANYNVTSLVTRPTTFGDTNEDGTTDIGDFTTVANYWQKHVSGGEADGDLNHDGIVDIQDETIVTNNWTNSGGTFTWQVTERLAYDGYGKFTTTVKDNVGTWHNWGDYLAWNYTFQGGRFDVHTGLVQFQERPWDTIGRWVSPEPSYGTPYVDGPDLYPGFGDNPINRLDPSGLLVKEAVIVTVTILDPAPAVMLGLAGLAAYLASKMPMPPGGIHSATYLDMGGDAERQYQQEQWASRTPSPAPSPAGAAPLDLAYGETLTSRAQMIANLAAKQRLTQQQNGGCLPIFHVYIDRTPIIALHDAYAIFHDGYSDLLHYGGPGTGDARREQATGGFPRLQPILGAVGNFSWDEYPFASTAEGGTGASVWPAPNAEQNQQGRDLAAFYAKNPNSTKGFRVEIDP